MPSVYFCDMYMMGTGQKPPNNEIMKYLYNSITFVIY